MKQIVFLVIFLLLYNLGRTQNIEQSNVPAVVLNAFQLKFSNASDISWKKEGKNYRIEFKVHNKKNKLLLDYKGNMIKHIQNLYLSEIPKTVLKTVGANVTYYDINNARKIQEKGETTYEIYFKNNGKDYLFRINEKGKLIKLRKELNNNEIPEKVLNTIKYRHPSFELYRAKYLEENDIKFYMLRGRINHYKCLWEISNKGDVLRYEQDLKTSELPAAIRQKVKEEYSNYQIDDADRLEQGKHLSYKLKSKKSRKYIYVTFSPSGQKLSNE